MHCLRSIRNSRAFFGGKRPRIHGIFARKLNTVPMRNSSLWRYFTAPGNVTFVATNLITLGIFMGHRTLHTIANKEGAFDVPEELSDAEMGLPSLEDIQKYGESSSINTTGLRNSASLYILLSTHVQVFELIKALFTAKTSLQLREETAEFLSQMDSETLAQVLEILLPVVKRIDPENPPKSIEELFKMVGDSSELGFSEMRNQVGFSEHYYNLLKSRAYLDLDTVEYMKNLSGKEIRNASLNALRESVMSKPVETTDDVARLFDECHSYQSKSIIAYWLYENLHNLKGTFSNNERLFEMMIQQSFASKDPALFDKYAGILLNPEEVDRRRIMFNSHVYHSRNRRCQTVSLSQFLLVMRGIYVFHEDRSIGTILSRLSKNCVLMGKDKELRVVLDERLVVGMPHDEKIEILTKLKSNQELMTVMDMFRRTA